jgi:hypothetical protein
MRLTGQGPTNPLSMCNGGSITVPTPPNTFEDEQGSADFTRTAPVDPEMNSPYTNIANGTGNWEGFIGEDVRIGDRAIWDGEEWRLIKEPRDNRPKSGGENADIILDAVYIYNPGFNYKQGDVIVVKGGGEKRNSDTGLQLIPTFNDIGQLVDVTILDPGSTFSSYPDIYIESLSGINAIILPIFKVRTVEDPDANARILSGDRIITVDDCVGRLVIGYVNGQPYYGPYHEHNGRKMVGRFHSPINHAYIYDTPEESLRDSYAKPTPAVGNAIPATEEVESPDATVAEQPQTQTLTVTPPSPTPTPPSPTPTPPSSGGSGGSGY